MQKMIDRYETKMIDMQKQIDSLVSAVDNQNQRNDWLNNAFSDFTDLHQVEMSTVKIDLRKLEEKLIYNINEYWADFVERLDKLDTRVRLLKYEFLVYISISLNNLMYGFLDCILDYQS